MTDLEGEAKLGQIRGAEHSTGEGFVRAEVVGGNPPAQQATERVLDPHAAEEFLSTLARDGNLTYQTFDDNRRRKDKKLARIRHGAITEQVDYFNKLVARGAGISCDFGPLSEVSVEMINVLFAALLALLDRHGVRVRAGERFGAPGSCKRIRS
jgi:hypothetical protein